MPKHNIGRYSRGIGGITTPNTQHKPTPPLRDLNDRAFVRTCRVRSLGEPIYINNVPCTNDTAKQILKVGDTVKNCRVAFTVLQRNGEFLRLEEKPLE